MNFLVVASTRPEVIKLAPVFKELSKRKISHVFATTGQHYDKLLFEKFIEDLELDAPEMNFEVGSSSHAVQTGMAMKGVEEIVSKDSFDALVVEGDTNSVVGAALAAVKMKIPVAHVESGLRSYDRTMPEEINRIVTDHCSELLFAPTEHSAINLINEGISPSKVHLVGNTIVDATLSIIAKAEKTSNVLELLPKKYLLLTLHRQENTESTARLKEILKTAAELGKKVVFPVHPRTRNILREKGLEDITKKSNIHLIEPLGYKDFLVALKNSYYVLTDSGGVQEEAIVLHVPCLTLRYNTERPESVWAGGNIIIGAKGEDILEAASRLEDKEIYKKMKKAVNPYGDGYAGRRIVDILVNSHKGGKLSVPASDTREGFYVRRFLVIDDETLGKRVKDLNRKVIRIIEGERTRFPSPDYVLRRGQMIEVLEKI